MEISITFFKTIQNKLHWAITGKTVAEIITSRVDSQKQNMGLTNWRGEKVRKTDISIAKNYLQENELMALNNLLEQYLVFAQGQAMQRIPMNMKDWINKLEAFMTINNREILADAGKISHELAKESAELEYEKYKKRQQKVIENSDFDKAIKKVENKKKSKKF